MTLDELNSLPESGGIGYKEELRDGKRVHIPVLTNGFALYQKEDDPLLILDENGQSWMVGWAHGIRWKKRMRW